jgi:hypothetical protein
MPVQSLRDDILEEQLDKLDEVRQPPVPVTAWLLLDERAWDGELLGWAANLTGADDGWRGLVRLTREYAPGFGRGSVLGARRADQAATVTRNPSACRVGRRPEPDVDL